MPGLSAASSRAKTAATANARNAIVVIGCALAATALASSSEPLFPRATSDVDWPVYGGNAAGQRFSSLTQINRTNVKTLAQAWRFDTGAGGLQTSPIMIGKTLYICAADQSIVALDAATGKQKWRFSSGVAGFQPARGVTLWKSGSEQRLFASSSFFLYALDPTTGRPISEFGDNGRIDLRKGLGVDPSTQATFLTTPGIIYQDIIITGFRTGEGAPASPGDIRAFDVRTGELRWSFKTIPEAGEYGSETWPANARATAGAANNWVGMALDEERGIVFVPTGSGAPDFYGANRTGDNLFANTLLALDARTGQRIWHFQAVHHDLWDRDFASPPSLVTINRNGRRIDAVVQASKQGFVFVFDRSNGTPLFPIVERPVEPSTVPGEQSSPTQPFPTLPEPISRQALTEDMLTVRTPAAHAAALEQFRKLRSNGPFTPFGTDRKTVMFPGFDGGAEWGGAAVDQERGILYINAQDVPWIGGLRENRPNLNATPGKELYEAQCAACHGIEREGNPPDFPALRGLDQRMARAAVESIIADGKGRMPGFPQFTAAQRKDLLDFLFAAPLVEGAAAASARANTGMAAEYATMAGSRQERFLFTGYEKFRDPDGYPAVKPPWGTLNAIDLNTGRYLWKVPLGEYPELVAAGQPDTGSENYGGPLLTASRLLFIGATIYDRKFRAFDARNGELLWQAVLPFAGNASPISYSVDGRQFVVIATSGGKDPKGPQGSAYVAFALPK